EQALKPVVEHDADAEALQALVVVQQALPVTVVVLRVPAQMRAEAGRPTPVELHPTLAAAAQPAPERHCPVVRRADMAEPNLTVASIPTDLRVVVAARRVRVGLLVLGNSPPGPQAQPPAVGPVERKFGEQPV